MDFHGESSWPMFESVLQLYTSGLDGVISDTDLIRVQN